MRARLFSEPFLQLASLSAQRQNLALSVRVACDPSSLAVRELRVFPSYLPPVTPVAARPGQGFADLEKQAQGSAAEALRALAALAGRLRRRAGQGHRRGADDMDLVLAFFSDAVCTWLSEGEKGEGEKAEGKKGERGGFAFNAPLRRFADLLAHREIYRQALQVEVGGNAPSSVDALRHLQQVRAFLTAYRGAVHAAEGFQRLLSKWEASQRQETFPGVIVEVTPTSSQVVLSSTEFNKISGFYRASPTAEALDTIFKPGDQVIVKIAHLVPHKSTLIFSHLQKQHF